MRLPRLYPILDTGTLARRECSIAAAGDGMLEGGARILQFRHKGAYNRQVFGELERLAARCREAGALLVVDDRADVALLVDAGVHVGQDDLPAAEARRLLGPQRVVGLSTHNAAQLEAGDKEPVDYLALGPVFPTASKDQPDPVLGLEGLRRLRPVTGKPLVAIGGITRATALAALEAGADSLAVISDLVPERPTRASVRGRMEEWQSLLR